MAIKKAFAGIIEFLEANQGSKVKTILPEAIQLCSAKIGGGGAPLFRKNDAGEVTHVFCYYHKMWELVDDVEYGAKANSATGLNNMCKEGVSQWSKQQREAKTAESQILTDLGAGTIAVSDIEDIKAGIEATRCEVVPRADGHGSAESPILTDLGAGADGASL
jgi:hypothetical protein